MTRSGIKTVYEQYKLIVLVLILFFGFGKLTAAGKTTIVPLPDVLNASRIYADDKQFYIVDNATVHIYSWQGYKHLKNFGSAGEGPQQFKIDKVSPIKIVVQDNKLQISSFYKISEFKKDGTFIDEKRIKDESFVYKLGDSFLLMVDLAIGSEPLDYYAWYLCNVKGEKIKELLRFRFPLNLYKQVWYVFTPFTGAVFYKNSAYFARGEEMEIFGINTSGKPFFYLNHPYQRVKFTNQHIQAYYDYYDAEHSNERGYNSFKKMLKFPDYFPAIKEFMIADDKIYVTTYKTNEKKETEFLIFSIRGKYIRSVWLPLVSEDYTTDYPYLFKNNTFIQLIEDVDEEMWSLHMTPLD